MKQNHNYCSSVYSTFSVASSGVFSYSMFSVISAGAIVNL